MLAAATMVAASPAGAQRYDSHYPVCPQRFSPHFSRGQLICESLLARFAEGGEDRGAEGAGPWFGFCVPMGLEDDATD